MDDKRESTETRESTLLCPRCASQMLPVQRFGVAIDQCTGCGGIFLDRGELEQLAEAEAKFYAAPQQPQQPPSGTYPPQQQYPAQPTYVEAPRPRGFLGGLFGEGYYGGRHGGYRGGHH
ncbi:zf-TFIIB domain-containing protein [Mycobacterium intracellulare]|uniref:TFIIB-type zinc ribbon-containing protein n=1 Tax=Mycobacterium intracellulare TaxID=1767 RepID=UPI0009F1BF3E|nr:zf-TFIIB domain-containing protein [Mycobacterium intracellulare]